MTRTLAESLVPVPSLPAGVRALQSLRTGGTSVAPYDSLNLGLHVGDAPERVRGNRALVRGALPADPLWLRQVHGTRVVDADAAPASPGGALGSDDATVEADGAATATPGRVLAVLTADCLPVVVANGAGTRVAVVHAGWRGLAGGIVRAAVAGFADDEPLHVWLGPAIGPDAFEVGAEVRDAFVRVDPAHADAFRAGAAPGKHLADLYALARLEARAVRRAGTLSLAGGERCTVAEPDAFFSHRRDGPRTGRMVTLAWLEPAVRAAEQPDVRPSRA